MSSFENGVVLSKDMETLIKELNKVLFYYLQGALPRHNEIVLYFSPKHIDANYLKGTIWNLKKWKWQKYPKQKLIKMKLSIDFWCIVHQLSDFKLLLELAPSNPAVAFMPTSVIPAALAMGWDLECAMEVIDTQPQKQFYLSYGIHHMIKCKLSKG